MNIYHVWRTDEVDYDEHDAFVCIAPDIEAAMKMGPYGDDAEFPKPLFGTWAANRDSVRAELVGTATPDATPGVVLASFNAG